MEIDCIFILCAVASHCRLPGVSIGEGEGEGRVTEGAMSSAKKNADMVDFEAEFGDGQMGGGLDEESRHVLELVGLLAEEGVES